MSRDRVETGSRMSCDRVEIESRKSRDRVESRLEEKEGEVITYDGKLCVCVCVCVYLLKWSKSFTDPSSLSGRPDFFIAASVDAPAGLWIVTARRIPTTTITAAIIHFFVLFPLLSDGCDPLPLMGSYSPFFLESC